MSRLVLRSGHERRIQAGHPWIFSNEIERIEGPAEPGCAVEVCSNRGKYLGTAYYNPKSLIAARILSRQREAIDDAAFFEQQIRRALERRRLLYGDLDALRIVHGEGDGLPGLVVDRYGEVLSLQVVTLGMDHRREAIVAALQNIFQPTAIVARNDVAVRELEGLTQQVEVLFGQVPEDLEVTEHGLRFKVDVLGGQKTGHFLDQKENHLALRGRVEGKRVLDLFCYSGSWSLHAAHFGASEVTGVDISGGAIQIAEENVRRNGLEGRCQFVKADVFDLLREMKQENRLFDTIVLDPPAFVKSKKKLKEAIKGYLTINRRAMELLAPGGTLYTCTCSFHMDRDTFVETIRQAGRKAGRTLQLLEMRGQAYDHPVLLNCPETEYLKCTVLQAND